MKRQFVKQAFVIVREGDFVLHVKVGKMHIFRMTRDMAEALQESLGAWLRPGEEG